MTNTEAREQFIFEMGFYSLAGLKREKDKPAIREAWSEFIDSLHREKRITDKQAQNWDQII